MLNYVQEVPQQDVVEARRSSIWGERQVPLSIARPGKEHAVVPLLVPTIESWASREIMNDDGRTAP